MTVADTLCLDDPGSFGIAWELEDCSSAGVSGLERRIREANVFFHVGQGAGLAQVLIVAVALSKLVLAEGVPPSFPFNHSLPTFPTLLRGCLPEHAGVCVLCSPCLWTKNLHKAFEIHLLGIFVSSPYSSVYVM